MVARATSCSLVASEDVEDHEMRLGRIVATVALVLIASAAVSEVKGEQLPDGGPSGRGNVVCTPNPLVLSFSDQDGTVSVY